MIKNNYLNKEIHWKVNQKLKGEKMKKSIILFTIVLVLASLYCTKNNPIASNDDNKTITKSSLSKSFTNLDYNVGVFGPEVFKRQVGQPITEVVNINLPNSSSKYLIVLNNGADDKESKVTSCFVIINNDTIIGPNEINKNINLIEKEISLIQNSQMTIRILGKPNSYLTITIWGICIGCCNVTDIDGNIYKTIKIGNQCWMAENLKVTKYRNGDAIPNVTDGSTWSNMTTGAYSNYDNNTNNVTTYGKLYNWYAINDSRNIAPEGWHVPSDAEWKVLEMFLGMSQIEADATAWRGTDEGGKLKEIGTSHWLSPNTGATNTSGFCALPGGYRDFDSNFTSLGYYALFWSTTEINVDYTSARCLGCTYSEIGRHKEGYSNRDGFSVRCVKD